MKNLIDKLYKERTLSREEFAQLITNYTPEDKEYLFTLAREVQQNHYGKKVYTRGLIEFTNYCKNDCLYCGIRCSNAKASRYRLTKEEILECCQQGYGLGFRTFVLQGGEDATYTDEKMVDIISTIRANYPDCAITLSVGEKSYETYKKYFDAGANRYLLRHETATDEHYGKLHPPKMLLSDRKQCLYDLKKIGYQTGTGFMVGSPYQTVDNIITDLFFMEELKPEMIGIGPFLSHHDTPFAGFANGTAELTTLLMAILRLMHPSALIPSTTALGTAEGDGREKGVLAGGNVVMPNLSPNAVRKKYLLYDNKICTDDEAAENVLSLKRRMATIGYDLTGERGDYIPKD
ncbi:MAG: [FeFe] hydrogenase H-cluster radical SAM maturase HydE [Oscillospiraceae bacterium]